MSGIRKLKLYKFPDKKQVISIIVELLHDLVGIIHERAGVNWKAVFAKGEMMRRKIILAIVAIIYVFLAGLGIYLGNRRNQPHTSTQPCVSSVAGPADTSGDTLVFVTSGGLWYHRGVCRELRQSRIPVKLSMVSQYCRPCTKCRP